MKKSTEAPLALLTLLAEADSRESDAARKVRLEAERRKGEREGIIRAVRERLEELLVLDGFTAPLSYKTELADSVRSTAFVEGGDLSISLSCTFRTTTSDQLDVGGVTAEVRRLSTGVGYRYGVRATSRSVVASKDDVDAALRKLVVAVSFAGEAIGEPCSSESLRDQIARLTAQSAELARQTRAALASPA